MTLRLLQFVQEQLSLCKGTWPAVAKEAGIDYCTIVRIGNGRAKDPAYRTIEKLATYFQREIA